MKTDELKTFSKNAEGTVENNDIEVVVVSPCLSAAEKMYKRHLTNVKRYQHKNS